MFELIGLTPAEIAGWAGTVLLVVAYFLLSAKMLTEGFWYQLLNVLGALGLLASAAEKANYPTVALEVVWIAIGLFAIAMIARRVSRKENPG